jgi:arylsulfatase A-like enzyme
VALWLRLVTLAITGLLFAAALLLQRRAEVFSLYLSTSEVIFEIVVRLVFGGLLGIALGTVCSVLAAPALWYFESARGRIIAWVTNFAVLLVVFLDSKLALKFLIKWSYNFGEHRGIFDTAAWGAFYLTFVLALCFGRSRNVVFTSFDGLLGVKTTQWAVVGTVAANLGLVVFEFALATQATPIKAASASPRPKSNVLLITFDAMSAEDLSLYGRSLPTTPNLDAFSRNATVFTNFYSTSTFTTPTIASIATGTYPSESGVYQLEGRLHDGTVTLPQLLRNAGYTTTGFFSNPFAYYLATGIRSDFDFLPEPVFHPSMHRVWTATGWFHQNTGLGSRIGEYLELQDAWAVVRRLPFDPSMRMRPDEVFAESKRLLDSLPEGYFLWIHLISPHNPYLPDAVDRGRFVAPDKPRTYAEDSGSYWMPHYQPDQQAKVNEHRLRYDEFVMTADRAFGSFMSQLEASGRLKDTTVIVSADHGESFEGGVYRHKNPDQTRPLIHIPLIIKAPGQQQGHRVAFTADETSLAPTILDFAGIPKPEGMRDRSLAAWVQRDDFQPGGTAYCQYLEENSVFKPLTHGTIGVIDGTYQYVLDLGTGKGKFRPLNEAQTWNLDRSGENPAKANELRAAIYSRFPALRRVTK